MFDRLDNKMRYDARDPSLGSAGLSTGNIVDPSLQDILRRPPVGTSYSPIPFQATRVQFNDNVRYDEPPPRQNMDQYRRKLNYF